MYICTAMSHEQGVDIFAAVVRVKERASRHSEDIARFARHLKTDIDDACFDEDYLRYQIELAV